jgi:ribosomal protein L29
MVAKLKAYELRKKPAGDLKKQLKDLKKELAELRVAQVNNGAASKIGTM